MENINKAEDILKKVLSFDDETLERIKFSKALYDLLKDTKLPSTLKEDILSFDGLSSAKKRAFAKYTLLALKQLKQFKDGIYEKKPEKTKTYSMLELKNINLKDISILKPIEKRALKKVGATNVKDALYYFPIKYEDKRIKKIKDVEDGETGLFDVEVVNIQKVNIGKIKLQATLTDGTGFLTANFVHNKVYLFNIFRGGARLLISGKVNVFRNEKSIFMPQVFQEEDSIILNRIAPVYSLRGDKTIKATSQTINHLRRAIFKLLKSYYKNIEEYMPEYILEKYKLPKINQAIKDIHFPDKNENLRKLNNFDTRYQKRFIFEELFLLQLAQVFKKKQLQKNDAYKIAVEANFIEEFEKNLPFKLTDAQKRVIKEILQDMSKDFPMNRLLQGDVGSGKTVVAMAGACSVFKNGYQTTVMAPTEILATQHFENLKKILEPLGVKIALLVGSLSQKEKKQIKRAIKEGYIDVVIGTHALIQDNVEFKDLALVIVDEQHRFGVEQRKKLTEKSKKAPHVLTMTATPIPRTLTLALYGDLDVSKIDQLPEGRKKVETVLIFDDERRFLYKKVREELERGRQVFVIYPLIEESEKLDLKSAEEGFKHWQEAFPDKKVVMLHGKMPQEEKDKIMKDFKDKKADILVSTTVIEVGVDVPNASVMVIEDAHRFGLSQIHQLRGRVGRGQYEGYCFLVAPHTLRKPSEDSSKEQRRRQSLEKLNILVSSNDGFKIAEKDLELRGSGDLVGTAQSGKFNFSIADLDRSLDKKILEYAKKEAEEVLGRNPLLENYPKLKAVLFDKYTDKFELANIA